MLLIYMQLDKRLRRAAPTGSAEPSTKHLQMNELLLRQCLLHKITSNTTRTHLTTFQKKLKDIAILLFTLEKNLLIL